MFYIEKANMKRLRRNTFYSQCTKLQEREDESAYKNRLLLPLSPHSPAQKLSSFHELMDCKCCF